METATNVKKATEEKATELRNAEDVLKNFENVIDVLRYHVATGRFGYVDRIMAAMDSSVVEETLREALRTAISAASNPKIAKGNRLIYDDKEKKWKPEEKESEITYAEEEKLEGPIPTRVFLHGIVMKVKDETKAFYTRPRIPSADELAKFFDAARRDLRVAKIAASLAMTTPAREEGG